MNGPIIGLTFNHIQVEALRKEAYAKGRDEGLRELDFAFFGNILNQWAYEKAITNMGNLPFTNNQGMEIGKTIANAIEALRRDDEQ